MGDEPSAPRSPEDQRFAARVAASATRKLRVQRKGAPHVWSGLGMSGLIGWSVVVPTLAGGLVGGWWDRRHPGTHSWTLMLLVIGLLLGCANAWHWVREQDRAMHEDTEDGDD